MWINKGLGKKTILSGIFVGGLKKKKRRTKKEGDWAAVNWPSLVACSSVWGKGEKGGQR
jgi:hypothetical protein